MTVKGTTKLYSIWLFKVGLTDFFNKTQPGKFIQNFYCMRLMGVTQTKDLILIAHGSTRRFGKNNS